MPTPTWGEGCATYPCVIYTTARGKAIAYAYAMPSLPYAMRALPVPMRTYDLPRGMEGLRQIYLALTRGRPVPVLRSVMPTLAMCYLKVTCYDKVTCLCDGTRIARYPVCSSPCYPTLPL